MQQPVLLLAKTGYIIRNLLLGTFADELSRHIPLLVAVPNPKDLHLKSIIAGKPIELVDFPVAEWMQSITSGSSLLHTCVYRIKQGERDTEAVTLQRRLFESSGGRKQQLFDNSLVTLGRVLEKFNLVGRVETYYLNRISKWEVTKRWQDLLFKHSPSIVLSTMLTHSTYHRLPSVDLPAVVAAHKQHIPVGSLVQSWDNLTSKASVLPAWVERHWTWSEDMAQELRTLNPRISSDKLEVVGSPQFDFHISSGIIQPRDRFMKRFGLDPDAPYIVIGTGTTKWTPSEPQNIQALVHHLHKELPKCQFLIRIHPKDDGKRWKGIQPDLEKCYPCAFQASSPSTHMDHGGFTPPADFYRDQVNCLIHSSLVINTASTLTVDAAILDRPVISIGFDVIPDGRFPEGRSAMFNRSAHFSKLVATGGVRVPKTLQECITLIRNYINNPALDRENRKQLVEVVAGKVDGFAGKRLADSVINLVSMGRPY